MSGSSMNSDRVTESDEPEARKRARLRLELAVAYFDKGQTTDALDHLKQSIAADPNLFEAYNMRGLIYMRLNDLPLAEGAFAGRSPSTPRLPTSNTIMDGCFVSNRVFLSPHNFLIARWQTRPMASVLKRGWLWGFAK